MSVNVIGIDPDVWDDLCPPCAKWSIDSKRAKSHLQMSKERAQAHHFLIKCFTLLFGGRFVHLTGNLMAKLPEKQ